jgi:membrane-associated protease RseP (regulator of RpoE activity)
MGFEIYDYVFAIVFCIAVAIFLYAKRKNLKREGIMFLYRTQLGVKFIDYIGTKFKRTLGFLQYAIIGTGFVLMAGVIYLITKSVVLYVTHPILVTKIIKAPPIAPVIPYFPKIFGMQKFFPEFPFTSFLISFLVVAFVHEFSHGIFMRFHNIRIKSTGMVFLGPILGAFVEQDDKDMVKRSKIAQMSVLGAGVFANLITAGIFFLLWMGLFYPTFSPVGSTFDMYMLAPVNTSHISLVGGITLDNPTSESLIKTLNQNSNNIVYEFEIEEEGKDLKFMKILADDKTYYMTLEVFKEQLAYNTGLVGLYPDLPAIKSKLKGTIIAINENTITGYNDMSKIMSTFKPGDEITLKTLYKGETIDYNLKLGSDPNNSSRAVLGVANRKAQLNIAETFAIFKEKYTEYQSNNDFLEFLYYLVFWVFLINLLVGFFNMLPVSILDGGRFFYLTLWGITKKEKIAKKLYWWTGAIILSGFVLMLIFYAIGMIAGSFF